MLTLIILFNIDDLFADNEVVISIVTEHHSFAHSQMNSNVALLYQ